MQFPFNVSSFLPLDQNGVCLLNGNSLKGSYMVNQLNSRHSGPSRSNPLAIVIDTMGKLSSKAQKLKTIITTMSKFKSTDQRLYISHANERVIGILKIGEKQLFYRDMIGDIKEIYCTCVLDFYVHESCQRRGEGKKLFEAMLGYEGLEPRKFAYDRPSPKLIGFLRKHYGLTHYVPQNNNFVIFREYFSGAVLGKVKGGRSKANKVSERKLLNNCVFITFFDFLFLD